MIKTTGAALKNITFSNILSTCGLSSSTSTSSGGTIKIGFVSPITGPASGFGEPNPYVIGLARKTFANGLTIKRTHYPVQIISKDDQSTPSINTQITTNL